MSLLKSVLLYICLCEKILNGYKNSYNFFVQKYSFTVQELLTLIHFTLIHFATGTLKGFNKEKLHTSICSSRPAFKNISSVTYIFFISFFYHQLHSGLRFFHIGLHKRLSKSLQGRLRSSARMYCSRILRHEYTHRSYVTILTSVVSRLYFPQKLHPQTFARIHYSPLTRIHSTGYCAHRTYCYGVFSAISFCFCNILRVF